MTIPSLNDMHSPSDQLKHSRSFSRRKGGGGGGGGKGGSGGVRGGSAGSSAKTGIHVFGSSGSAYQRAKGGGTPQVIQAGQAFAGRQMGGGTRVRTTHHILLASSYMRSQAQVAGTSQYGSGYPYGGYGSFTSYRPFPFGFWPLYISPGYQGCDEVSLFT